MKFAGLACVAALVFVGCHSTSKTVPIPTNRPTTGLRNPGAFPSENFGNGGATPCGTRSPVDRSLSLFGCPPADDGDEFSPRNACNPALAYAPQPVVYQQQVTTVQQTPSVGLGVNIGASVTADPYADIDPAISAGVNVGIPTPVEM